MSAPRVTEREQDAPSDWTHRLASLLLLLLFAAYLMAGCIATGPFLPIQNAVETLLTTTLEESHA